jgi:hypothetical protein
MNNHLETYNLELLFLDASQISNEEKERIFLHIKKCSYCESNYLKMKSFYEEIESAIESEPSIEDSNFAKKLLPKKKFFQK